MKQEVISQLKLIVGKEYVVESLSEKLPYLYDSSNVNIRPQASEDSI